MPAVDQLLRAKRADVLAVAAERGARNVRVFGSVARGEADETSDIDLVVDMEPGRSLLDLGGLWSDLNAPRERIASACATSSRRSFGPSASARQSVLCSRCEPGTPRHL